MWPGFDSILVRLKAHCSDRDDVDLKGFDSILVRLKGLLESDYKIRLIRFDSILVRLKVRHYLKDFEITVVSIPYWFD